MYTKQASRHFVLMAPEGEESSAGATPEEALLDALGPEDEEEKDVPDDDPDGVVEGDEAPDESDEEPGETPEKVRIEIKDEFGQTQTLDLTQSELAEGYMLKADYTRKTQALAREIESQVGAKVTEVTNQVIDRLNQLQAVAIRQAAPELNGVDWVNLSVNDPAEFVRLQAKQQQLQATLQGLEQQKQDIEQQQEQHYSGLVDQALKQSDELLARSIKDFDRSKAATLLQDIEKHVGWKPSDLRAAAQSLAKGGLHPQTLGQVLLLAHEAIQYRKLKASKGAALKKVADAPKVIKPQASQPKKTNQAALDRLKKTGRGLEAFL